MVNENTQRGIERVDAASVASAAEDDIAIIASLVVNGDVSRLNDAQLVAYYKHECDRIGVDYYSRPFDLLKLNGREILYANRRCADQLAAKNHITRSFVDPPQVRDFGGTKLVYCCVRATLPSGRTEEDIATLSTADLVNALMKVATKGSRRVVLKITGCSLLDESEIETIPGEKRPGRRIAFAPVAAPAGALPAAVQAVAFVTHPQDGERVAVGDEPADERAFRDATAAMVAAPAPAEAAPPASAPLPDGPPALVTFLRAVAEIELPGEAVALWIKHRAELAPLADADKEAAWKALCRRTEDVGKMKNAKVWLKRAVAEEEARRAA